MNDLIDFMQRRKDQETNRRKFLFQQFRDRATKLKENNVYLIEIQYSGYGDSGDVEDIEYFDRKNKLVEINQDDYGHCCLWPKDEAPSWCKDKNHTIDDLVSEMVYYTLPGGWEINEGSTGTVVINMETGSIDVNHGWRQTVIESESYNYNIGGE